MSALTLHPSIAHADLVPVDADTWREDFDGPALKGWQVPPAFVLDKDGDRTVLRAGGPTEEERKKARLAYALVDPVLDDYAVECKIRKMTGGWAGLVFRRGGAGNLEVVFREDGRLMVRRIPQYRVITTAQLPPSKTPYRLLRVVGLGPVIRVYVDGQKVYQMRDEELLKGKAGLVAHDVHAYFDDFVVTRALRPEESVLIGPADEQAPLLAVPGKPFTAELALWTGFKRRQSLSIEWALLGTSGDGQPVGSKDLEVDPGQTVKTPIEVSGLAEGINRVAVTVKDDDRALERVVLPIAAVEPPDEAPEEPFFPVGVYDKYALGGDPWFRDTYLHAMCADLRRHGVNTMLSGGVMNPPTLEQMDIVSRYGMKVVLRMDRRVTPEVAKHAAVICYMLGDEPNVDQVAGYRKRYEALAAEYPGKPIVSALVGDNIGTRAENDPWMILPILQPELVLIRNYPIRKSSYNLVSSLAYKGWVPINAAFRLFEVSAGDRAWWYVAQTFGANVTEKQPEPYWRNPNGRELSGMCHLALAHGARGILCYTYQVERESWPALVNPETLRPVDDKYDALAAVSRQIAPAREILLNAAWYGWDVRVEPSTVEAVARTTPDGRRFLYLVNRDTDRPADCSVKLMSVQGEDGKKIVCTEAVDLFTGTVIPMTPHETFSTARVRLEPGAGQLWEATLNSPKK